MTFIRDAFRDVCRWFKDWRAARRMFCHQYGHDWVTPTHPIAWIRLQRYGRWWRVRKYCGVCHKWVLEHETE